jgi:TatD DNase family protein
MFFDTHCHLNSDDFANDIEGYIKRAKAAGVDFLLVVGWDDVSSQKAVDLAEKYPNIFAAVGFHPCDVLKVPEDRFAVIKRLLSHPKVVALGEIGLDYYWNKTEEEHEIQRKYFVRQIELANRFNKPVVIHSRDAMAETLALLKENKPVAGGVMHCYSGPKEMVPDFLSLGLYISLGGPVTFSNARVSKEVAKFVPLKNLLIETDAPYLAPTPNRGKKNESSYLPLIASEIGALRGLDAEDIGEWTTRNAKALFHVKP